MEKLDLSSFSSFDEMLKKIKEDLDTKGIVVYKNLSSESQLIQIAESLGPLYIQKGGRTVMTVTEKVPEGFLFNTAFTHEELELHNDRATEPLPPKYLFTHCREPAVSGGETTIADSGKLRSTLLKEDEAMYKLMSSPNAALFMSHDSVFQRFPIFDQTPDGQELIRFRMVDGFTAFGPKLAARFHELLGWIKNLRLTLTLEKGEGYMLDNHRWIHGRLGYSGHREVAVILSG